MNVLETRMNERLKVVVKQAEVLLDSCGELQGTMSEIIDAMHEPGSSHAPFLNGWLRGFVADIEEHLKDLKPYGLA